MQVGDLKYPGYPASGAKLEGVNITDPAVKIAFIALRYDQDVNTPMYAYAKDEAGNAARADFDRLTFPKPFKKSRIPLDDKFIERVVPAILETTTEVNPQGSNDREVPGHQQRAAPEERGEDRQLRRDSRRRRCSGAARRSVPFGNTAVEVGVRGSADLRLRREGRRPPDASGLRSRARRATRRSSPANRGKVVYAGAARHLRQLRDHRPRHGGPVALRPPVVDRACRSATDGREGAGARARAA